jgi:release factor glutamine methyltransferase
MADWTAGKVLAWAQEDFRKRGLASPRFEAEVLLAKILGIRRIDIYTGYERPLEAIELKRYRNAILRRRAGEPTAYITGQKEFWSLSFEVTPSVLIPRPDTETLIEAALKRHTGAGPCLDLCTGTGCVAIALASERPLCRIDASDISPEACAVAARNIQNHRMTDRVRVSEGDLFHPFPQAKQYALITANPPYIRSSEIPHLQIEVQKEPRLALDGGLDGLDIVRRIVAAAPDYLAPHGWLLMEVDHRQIPKIVDDIAAERFNTREVIADLSGLERVVALKKEPPDESTFSDDGQKGL